MPVSAIVCGVRSADDDHHASNASNKSAAPRDYERNLGVAEAFIAVRDQCPMGAVRSVAIMALEAARTAGRAAASSGAPTDGAATLRSKVGDKSILREQAFLVLTAIQGWRGERARQVHRSLQAFLDSTERKR